MIRVTLFEHMHNNFICQKIIYKIYKKNGLIFNDVFDCNEKSCFFGTLMINKNREFVKINLTVR